MKKEKAKQKKSNDFKESWIFLKENKNYIYFAIGIFVFFALFGYFVSPPAELELQIMEMIKQIMQRFEGLSMIQTIWAIFTNNLSTSFFSFILGILFGVFPLIVLISNGYILGFVANKAVSEEGIFVLWRIFPHGIFELPAVMISTALGIAIGLNLFKQGFKQRFLGSAKSFLYIVVPLLIIAAIIEGVLVVLLK